MFTLVVLYINKPPHLHQKIPFCQNIVMANMPSKDFLFSFFRWSCDQIATFNLVIRFQRQGKESFLKLDMIYCWGGDNAKYLVVNSLHFYPCVVYANGGYMMLLEINKINLNPLHKWQRTLAKGIEWMNKDPDTRPHHYHRWHFFT